MLADAVTRTVVENCGEMLRVSRFGLDKGDEIVERGDGDDARRRGDRTDPPRVLPDARPSRRHRPQGLRRDRRRPVHGLRLLRRGRDADPVGAEEDARGEASDAAGAYPITPSTQMGELWAEAAAQGHQNISGRPLIFIEPEE